MQIRVIHHKSITFLSAELKSTSDGKKVQVSPATVNQDRRIVSPLIREK